MKREIFKIFSKFFLIVLLIIFLVPGGIIRGETRGVFSTGLFNFNQSQFRQIYGQLPVYSLSLEMYFHKNWGVAAGFIYSSKNGQAKVISGTPDEFPVNFNRVSVPLLLKTRLIQKRFQLSAGLGLAYSSYRENWKNVDLSYHGHTFHFRYELNLDYGLSDKIFLRAGFVGEPISTGIRSVLLNGAQANVGGLSFLLGIGYKIN